MTEVPIDQITDIVTNCDRFKECSFTFTPKPEILDISDSELKITSDLNLNFSSNGTVRCKKISIAGCSVQLTNLDLIGALVVTNGILILQNCRIHDITSSVDYLLIAQNSSVVDATNCIFENSPLFGVACDDNSSLRLSNCTVKNTTHFSVIITGLSSFLGIKTNISHSHADSLYIDTDSRLTLSNCNISNCDRRGITANSNSILNICDSVIENCGLGAIFATCCVKVSLVKCTFKTCGHTCIYFEHTTSLIKNCQISKCTGNGVNAAHGSKILMKKTSISNTTYPPLAICEGSFGLIKKCRIEDSEMSGVIVRLGSTATIEDTTIERSAQSGISISDSHGIILERCTIFDSAETGISCYNHSIAEINNSMIINPGKIGINAFTGGQVAGKDITIVGATEIAVWAHLGGSLDFFSPLLEPRQLKGSISEILENISELLSEKLESAKHQITNSNGKIDPRQLSTNLLRNDSIRKVAVHDGYAVGKGFFDFSSNSDSNPSLPGINASPPHCKICNQDARDCHFSPCGHCVYCRDCWNRLSEKPVACELCQMPVEAIVAPRDCSVETDEYMNKVCSICMINVVDTFLVPCGHTMCFECAKKWFDSTTECPYCRDSSCRYRQDVSYE